VGRRRRRASIHVAFEADGRLAEAGDLSKIVGMLVSEARTARLDRAA
jgi:hypothetical protein